MRVVRLLFALEVASLHATVARSEVEFVQRLFANPPRCVARRLAIVYACNTKCSGVGTAAAALPRGTNATVHGGNASAVAPAADGGGNVDGGGCSIAASFSGGCGVGGGVASEEAETVSLGDSIDAKCGEVSEDLLGAFR